MLDYQPSGPPTYRKLPWISNMAKAKENIGKNEPDYFCFGHGVGAHVCGIAGISEKRLKEMNTRTKYQVCPYQLRNT